MTFSRKQVATMVGCSLRTIDRHIASGKLAVEKTEGTENFEQSVTISLEALGSYLGIADQELLRERLGLPQESVAQLATHVPEPSAASLSDSDRHPVRELTASPKHEPSNVEKQRLADLEFAEQYRAGLITDSFGNSIHGGDGTTALGPRPDLCIGYSPDSNRNLRYQPIRFHDPYPNRPVHRKSGYGVTQEDLEEESRALAARRFSR